MFFFGFLASFSSSARCDTRLLLMRPNVFTSAPRRIHVLQRDVFTVYSILRHVRQLSVIQLTAVVKHIYRRISLERRCKQ